MVRPNFDNAPGVVMDAMPGIAKDCLRPRLRKLFLQYLLEKPDTGAAAPPDPRDVLSKFIMLSAQPCCGMVKMAVGISIMNDLNPIHVFFRYLPSPSQYEQFHEGVCKRALTQGYGYALEVLKYLTVINGRESMLLRCRDPMLKRLFHLLDLAGRLSPKVYHSPFLKKGMIEEIISIALAIRPGTEVRQIFPECDDRTCHLLEYLSWVSRGRKDSECTIRKPWDNRDPAEVRKTAAPDLSRLHLCGMSSQGARCFDAPVTIPRMRYRPDFDGGQANETEYSGKIYSEADLGREEVSCEETERFCRLARLFMVAFSQFILSITGRCRSIHNVSTYDGIVSASVDGPVDLDEYPDSPYAGIAADIDLSLPEVKAVLHAYMCCAIKGPAQGLLEYFFRASSANIQFMDFVPKNAHTPVEFVNYDVMSTFNMLYSHSVALLTTGSGRKFILDPTAAQYGWKENFATLETYSRCRVDRDYGTSPCHPPDGRRVPAEHSWKPGDIHGGDRWESQLVAEQVMKLVDEHLHLSGGLDVVIQLPQHQFKEQCRSLEEALRFGMDVWERYAAFFHTSGRSNTWADAAGSHEDEDTPSTILAEIDMQVGRQE